MSRLSRRHDQGVPDSMVEGNHISINHCANLNNFDLNSIWLNPACVSVSEYNLLPAEHKDKKNKIWMTRILPPDAYTMSGFDGQYVTVIPSLRCVIVRLGMTPDIDKDDKSRPRSFSKPEFFGTLSNHCRRLNSILADN